MASNEWKKVENEAGYPCYVNENTGKQEFDHPQFRRFLESLKEYDGVKYSAYRIAFKIFALQSKFRVPPLRISSGVFARHQLSLSESSLSLDTTELEAVLADIYFAAEKEDLFDGDVDLAVDLLINMLLNVYDKDRQTPIRVLAAKTLLILFSEESVADKWLALANCCADHNGCVSPKRLAALLVHVTALPKYLGCSMDQIQTDVDSCFNKSAGMLGMSARAVAEWGARSCVSTAWLGAAQRVLETRDLDAPVHTCTACAQPLVKVLKFKCSKCTDVYFCENCYLYDKDLTTANGHKKTHLVLEIIDGEVKPSECLSFIKGMKRFFFCTKTKKKNVGKKGSKKTSNKVQSQASARRKDGKPAIYTSTVSKASGNSATSPANTLQDIIHQLETQNKALQDLSSQLQNTNSSDHELKAKVDAHYDQISAQINRLKILKDNLAQGATNLPMDMPVLDKNDRPQAFDLFSPIPIVDEKQPKVSEELKNQPRVLSMDSGNFSVASKQVESQNLLTVSGDALKPVVVHATSDSISTVSMNDISNWYNDRTSFIVPSFIPLRMTNTNNETESVPPDKRFQSKQGPNPQVDCTSQSISATEQRFAADIRSVANSNDKMKELNADLDTVLDRLQQILTHNFTVDESCFDNTQLRETANEMEGLLGTLIRGVEQRATLNATKGLV